MNAPWGPEPIAMGRGNQRRGERPIDGAMIGDFILDICPIKGCAVQCAELAGFDLCLPGQGLARLVRLGRNSKLFHKGQRLIVHGRMISNHRLGEGPDCLVARFSKGLLARFHVNLPRRVGDVRDLSIIRTGGLVA